MINFLKHKILNKENRIYISMFLVLILGCIITCSIERINLKNRGVVINKIPMMERLEKNKIGIYIDGEVNKIGYIKLEKGSTLEQAINKAGGITNRADIENIDVKKILKNQEKIVIPARKEVLEEIVNEIYTDKINLNLATKEELLKLDGIGEKTADSILQYRQNKRFDSIEEIKEVKGIGENKFEKIKEKICI